MSRSNNHDLIFLCRVRGERETLNNFAQLINYVNTSKV